ncbi:hypothetical protein Btru_050202 [Bulinus truncatus]|nr:hypothetical protein Btru_050202 [Bulinus truncatus]
MSDTDLEQPSNSFDDAIEGALLGGVAATGSGAIHALSEYQPGAQFDAIEHETAFNGTHRGAGPTEESNLLDTRSPQLAEAMARAKRNPIEDIDQASVIRLLRDDLGRNSDDLGRGRSRYGSCECPPSGGMRSCCGGVNACMSKKCASVSGLVLSVCLILATTLYFAVIQGFAERLRENLKLRPNNTLWEQPNGQVFLRMYYFNLTNLNEVIFGREMPVVHEVGPFVYRGVESRTNLTWKGNNSSVSYNDRFVYKLDERMSAGLENAVIMSVDLEPLVEQSVNRMLPSGPQFRKFKVKKFLSAANQLEMSNADVYQPLRAGGLSFRPFNRKNGTERFNYSMTTGTYNFSEYYNIYAFNNNPTLPYWFSDEANEIYGSDGTAFPPFLTKSSRPVVFDARMYRRFTLQFQGETTLNGVKAYRFIIPDSEFVNGTDEIYYNNTVDVPSRRRRALLPDTAADPRTIGLEYEETGNGYCTPICVPAGLYSIRTIQSGHHPLFLSNPHFLGADRYYARLTHGVEPDESKHRSIFDVHELTGQVIRMIHRAQTVYFMDNHLSEIYLPLFWRETELLASQEVIDEAEGFRLKYNAVLFVVYFLLVVSGLCFIHVLVVLIRMCVTANRREEYSEVGHMSPCNCHCCTPICRRFSNFIFCLGTEN